MIEYHHGAWGVAFIFKLTGSVFPKACAWSIPSSALAAVLWFIKVEMGYEDTNTTTSTASAAVGAYVTILGFMLVFRSNQAWSRFWEGGTLVQTARGQWFNATSSLFAFCSSKPEHQEEVQKFQELTVRLMSLLFATALSTISDGSKYEILSLQGIDQNTMEFFQSYDGDEERIELLLNWVQRTVVRAADGGVLPVAPPILARVFNELSIGVVHITSARKINDIPFPFHYAQMLAVMLMLYTIGVPALTAYFFTTPIGAACSTFLNVTVLWAVNYLAVEIETPFGDLPNDLPLEDEVHRMNKLLSMLLLDGSQRTPTFSAPDPQLEDDNDSAKEPGFGRAMTFQFSDFVRAPKKAIPGIKKTPSQVKQDNEKHKRNGMAAVKAATALKGDLRAGSNAGKDDKASLSSVKPEYKRSNSNMNPREKRIVEGWSEPKSVPGEVMVLESARPPDEPPRPPGDREATRNDNSLSPPSVDSPYGEPPRSAPGNLSTQRSRPTWDAGIGPPTDAASVTTAGGFRSAAGLASSPSRDRAATPDSSSLKWC